MQLQDPTPVPFIQKQAQGQPGFHPPGVAHSSELRKPRMGHVNHATAGWGDGRGGGGVRQPEHLAAVRVEE